ncbi:F0F1 ATP synthase subunit B [Blattabacterium cuenoti]|uniref:F0F1 ATP synthase subunit B n=1 Tax=Blattabacterium cuenoti TaxID=1653831 RepID=UPI00163B62FD|nr:F0F1 ATP synthase subunit B [Blattabacterium cuenoti]
MDLVTPSIGLVIWQSIIFLLLIFFLSQYAWKPIMQFIDKREEKIRNSIKKADLAKNQLNIVENKINQILKETRIKRDSILKDAIKMREKIKNKAVQEGILEKKKILQESKKNIQLEKKTAIQEFKNQIGDISIKIAEKILKKEFDTKINNQEEWLKKLVNKL